MTGWAFKAIDDYGGPGTLSDLLANNIQVADIYTTTPSIKQNDLVVLEGPGEPDRGAEHRAAAGRGLR